MLRCDRRLACVARVLVTELTLVLASASRAMTDVRSSSSGAGEARPLDGHPKSRTGPGPGYGAPPPTFTPMLRWLPAQSTAISNQESNPRP
eukprot:4890898-Prymnesium_polylepis.1